MSLKSKRQQRWDDREATQGMVALGAAESCVHSRQLLPPHAAQGHAATHLSTPCHAGKGACSQPRLQHRALRPLRTHPQERPHRCPGRLRGPFALCWREARGDEGRGRVHPALGARPVGLWGRHLGAGEGDARELQALARYVNHCTD